MTDALDSILEGRAERCVKDDFTDLSLQMDVLRYGVWEVRLGKSAQKVEDVIDAALRSVAEEVARRCHDVGKAEWVAKQADEHFTPEQAIIGFENGIYSLFPTAFGEPE